MPDDMNGSSAAEATNAQADRQGPDGRPAGAGRQAPLGLGPLETAVMQTLWNAGRWLMNREIHDLLDYRKPVVYTTVAAISGNLHTKGLVCRRLIDAPGHPGLPAWHYHAAQSQAEHIGALIATLLDHSPSPAETLAHALAATRTPIPVTPASCLQEKVSTT